MDRQRHPILGRLSGEAVLGEVWPVERWRLVIAQQGDARQVLLPPQSGLRQSPSVATADHDFFRSAARLPRGFGLGLATLLVHHHFEAP